MHPGGNAVSGLAVEGRQRQGGRHGSRPRRPRPRRPRDARPVQGPGSPSSKPRLTWRFAGAMLAQTGVILAAVIGADTELRRRRTGWGEGAPHRMGGHGNAQRAHEPRRHGRSPRTRRRHGEDRAGTAGRKTDDSGAERTRGHSPHVRPPPHRRPTRTGNSGADRTPGGRASRVHPAPLRYAADPDAGELADRRAGAGPVRRRPRRPPAGRRGPHARLDLRIPGRRAARGAAASARRTARPRLADPHRRHHRRRPARHPPQGRQRPVQAPRGVERGAPGGAQAHHPTPGRPGLNRTIGPGIGRTRSALPRGGDGSGPGWGRPDAEPPSRRARTRARRLVHRPRRRRTGRRPRRRRPNRRPRRRPSRPRRRRRRRRGACRGRTGRRTRRPTLRRRRRGRPTLRRRPRPHRRRRRRRGACRGRTGRTPSRRRPSRRRRVGPRHQRWHLALGRLPAALVDLTRQTVEVHRSDTACLQARQS